MTAQDHKAFVTQWRIRPPKTKAPKARTRTWAPKVRTGCRTCKTRKLKCDEEKPECHRCVKAGFDCEYATSQSFTSEGSQESQNEACFRQHLRLSNDHSFQQESTPAAVPSFWADRMDCDEQRALLHFKERTVPILSSFAHGSSQFWTRIIPQMSLSDGTVRSAMIAASSLHENVHYRGRSLQPGMIPQKLYAKHLSKSMQALTIPDQPPSREIILITCLLFLACENLKQSSRGAQLHVEAGLKVLREWKLEKQGDSWPSSYIADSFEDVIENHLEPIFARLEGQVSLTKEPAESRGYFQSYDLNWDRPVVPDTFADLFAARDSMHDNVQYCFYQSRLSGGPFSIGNPAFKQVAQLFHQWNIAFTSSFPQCDDRSWPGWTAASALRVHHLCLTLSLHGEANDMQTYWGEHLDDVKWLLDICADIITGGPPATDQPDSIWLYDFCLNPPLFLTAMHTRHPAMRRKAITLMRVQHCWDKTESFDACSTAKICEIIMQIEEANLPAPPLVASDIPRANRIRPLMVWLAEPGKIKLFYDRADNQTVCEKEVEWEHWKKPAIETLFVYPFGELVKYGQFQGLIRPARQSCLCKTYGNAVEEEWFLLA